VTARKTEGQDKESNGKYKTWRSSLCSGAGTAENLFKGNKPSCWSDSGAHRGQSAVGKFFFPGVSVFAVVPSSATLVALVLLLLCPSMPATATQSKAATCLKFTVFRHFFKGVRMVILVPNTFKKLASFGHAK